MPLLTLDDIAIAPLAGFSASVMAGDIIALTGESGSGKSRLLHAIADMLPHDGKAAFNNTPCDAMIAPQWRQNVMLLPSHIEWWFDSAREHFPDGTPDSDQLASLNLTEQQLTQPVNELSTGQKQRLALLRVVCRQPAVLLLDEPTANLDHKNTIAVEDLIKAWVRFPERAVIWCTHDPAQRQRVANRHWQVENHQIRETSL